MGNISTTIADISIFTAEDPRSEDVNVIIEQMIEGALISGAKKASTSNLSDIYNLSGSNIYTKIPERGEAISFAINKIAVRGDTVVICGKGHEKSMAYGGVEYPWSDKDAVEAALSGRIKRIVKE
jgi:UDP-N-acetylmuramoyl-L-alanyl-D-glutamate--2,6-diaminopimelate ligase